MIVMGVDNSTDKTGWAIMENKKLIAYDEVHLSKLIKKDDRFLNKEYIDRIVLYKEILSDVIEKYNVQVVGFESPIVKSFGGKATNAQIETFGKLREALGVLKVTLIEKEMLYQTFYPSEWRKGKGLGRKRAEMKRKAIEYANENYGLNLLWKSENSVKNQDDVAEAICIAEHLDSIMNKK